MSTALQAPLQIPLPSQQTDPAVLSDSGEANDWKLQLTRRVESYRSKRPENDSVAARSSHIAPANPRATRIAQAVAARYADAPTYRELIALEAAEREQQMRREEEMRAELAEQEAVVAALESLAREAAAASLADASLDQLSWGLGDAELSAGPVSTQSESSTEFSIDASAARLERTASPKRTALTGTAVLPPFASRNHSRRQEMHTHQESPEPEPSLEDLLAYSVIEPPAALPAKLIEFPRELVSARRARLRSPEPPQREEIQRETAAVEQERSQLRIFEVSSEVDQQPSAMLPTEQAAPEVAATVLSPVVTAEKAPSDSQIAVPDSRINSINSTGVVESRDVTDRMSGRLRWSAISLDRDPAADNREAMTRDPRDISYLVDPASIDRRLMAFAVDFAAVSGAFLGFLLVFAASTPHLPTGRTAVLLGGAVYAALWLLYQMLFFSLSGATAGMMYAKIALCTFDEQNPSRPSLRRRLAAWWLSLLPLGLGLWWAFVDEDNLCWHDRMTNMYQRSY